MNNSWEFTLFSWQEPRKLDHRLAVLIVFMILRVHGSYFMIFPQLFEKFFHNKVIIYNTRNQSNDTKKVRKKKNTCFNSNFQYSQPKIMDKNGVYFLNKMY